MQKINIKIFTAIIFLSGFFLLTSSFVFAQNNVSAEPTGGIVPCGTDTPCTLCHLILGIQRIVQYGLYLVTTMAFVGIFIGGAMYMISVGDPGAAESAKKFIGGSLIGFALVLGAWLIVNIILNILPVKPMLGIQKTNWYTFSCSTVSTAGSGKNDGSTPSIPTTATGAEGSKCGEENRGICTKTIQLGVCPTDYRSWPSGSCKSGLGCCIKDSDLIKKNSEGKDVISCGTSLKGTCFSNTAGICPSGWVEYSGGGSNCISKGNEGVTKCCIEATKKNEKGENVVGCGKDLKGTCIKNTFLGQCPAEQGWRPYSGSCTAKDLSEGITACCIKD